MGRHSCCKTHIRISRLRQVTPSIPPEQESGTTLLLIPDGFEGAPLGFWCPVCGLEVAEPEQFLALVEARRSGQDGARWLMPVHRACCAWPTLH